MSLSIPRGPRVDLTVSITAFKGKGRVKPGRPVEDRYIRGGEGTGIEWDEGCIDASTSCARASHHLTRLSDEQHFCRLAVLHHNDNAHLAAQQQQQQQQQLQQHSL